MDSVQQIYVTNQTPLSQTFRASKPNLINIFIGRDTASVELFFNILTSGIETFVIPWEQLLYPCVVEVCRLGLEPLCKHTSCIYGPVANFYCLNICDL